MKNGTVTHKYEQSNVESVANVHGLKIIEACIKMAYNGSRLGEVGDLEAQSLNFSTNFK